jgi:hypothetical protein
MERRAERAAPDVAAFAADAVTCADQHGWLLEHPSVRWSHRGLRRRGTRGAHTPSAIPTSTK